MGTKLIEILKAPTMGVVEVAGSNYYPEFPGTWWNANTVYLNFSHRKNGIEEKHLSVNFESGEIIKEAKGLDGVFLACTKNVFEEFPFDERLKGYHGYDLIFSLKICKNYKSYVTNQIKLVHFSDGNADPAWLDAIILVNKIIGKLPNQKTDKEIEKNTIIHFARRMYKMNFSKKEIIARILQFISFKNLSFRGVVSITNFIVKLNR